ncbi:MAG: hypothetical protein AB7H90_20075 [Alphaproteobacteria bacterium]
MEAWSWAGENVLPRGRKTQAILAYLAMSVEATVPRVRLMRLLWSKRWDEQARASLRQSLMELKRCIGSIDPELLKIEKDRVLLQSSKVWIDRIGFWSEMQCQTPVQSRMHNADTFLESLRGVDPAFDEWIQTRSAALFDEGDTKGSTRHVSAGAWPCRLAPAPRMARVPDRSASVNNGSPAAPQCQPSDKHLPTISVTPFIDLDGDPSTLYLSTSFTREVIAALARFRWFTVRLGQLDKAEDSQYRLDGSVSSEAAGYRVTVRLLDCRDSGRPVWVHQEHLDRTALQHFLGSVAERVVEHVDPEILSIETRRARSKTSTDCAAYECLLQAVHLVYSFERKNWESARTWLEQAIAKDPQLGRAYAVSAAARSVALSQGWIASSEAEIGTLDAYATRAIQCDPYDSMALAISAHVRLRVKRDFDYAIPTYERALRLNPSCGFAWGYSAIAYGYLGQTDEAMRRLRRARYLMVYDSFGQFLYSFEMPIAYCSRDWSRTIALGMQFAADGVRVNNMYKLLVAALCQTGRFDEARQYNRTVMRLEPGFSWRCFIAGYPFGREEDRLMLGIAISRAGLIDDADAGASAVSSNVVMLPSDERERFEYIRLSGPGKIADSRNPNQN